MAWPGFRGVRGGVGLARSERVKVQLNMRSRRVHRLGHGARRSKAGSIWRRGKGGAGAASGMNGCEQYSERVETFGELEKRGGAQSAEEQSSSGAQSRRANNSRKVVQVGKFPVWATLNSENSSDGRDRRRFGSAPAAIGRGRDSENGPSAMRVSFREGPCGSFEETVPMRAICCGWGGGERGNDNELGNR